MDRARVWLAVSPLVASGVLVAHGLAYRLTQTPSGSAHAYLDHAPQVLAVLVLVGVALAGLTARARRPSVWPFAIAAPVTFVLQEHLERVAHGGEVPSVLDTRAFIVGFLLQLPIAVLVWALARRLLGILVSGGLRRPPLPGSALFVLALRELCLTTRDVGEPRERGPPLLRMS